MKVTDLIFSILGYSLLEECVITYILLFLIKFLKISNHNYFEIGYNYIFSKNIIKIFFIVVFPVAIVSNILSLIHINDNMTTLIAIGLMYLLVIFLFKNDLDNKKRIALLPLTVISFFIICGIDALIYKLLFFITHTNMELLTQNITHKIIFGIFPRLIELLILGVMLFKNNIGIKTNVVQRILKNKCVLLVSSMFIIMNTICAILFCQNIILNTIMKYSSDFSKIIATLGIYTYCILSILICYFIATFIQLDERKKYKYGT
jgi:hypothetical protein